MFVFKFLVIFLSAPHVFSIAFEGMPSECCEQALPQNQNYLTKRWECGKQKVAPKLDTKVGGIDDAIPDSWPWMVNVCVLGEHFLLLL